MGPPFSEYIAHCAVKVWSLLKWNIGFLIRYVLKVKNSILSFVGAKTKFLAEIIQIQNFVVIEKLTPNRFLH